MRIPRNIIKPLIAHTNDEDKRYALGAVLFCRQLGSTTCQAIASDGRQAMVIEWEDDCDEAIPDACHVMIDAGALKTAASGADWRKTARVTHWEITDADQRLSDEPIKITIRVPGKLGVQEVGVYTTIGRYPDIHDCWKSMCQEEYMSVSIDANYLKLLAASLQALTPDTDRRVVMSVPATNTAKKPVLFMMRREHGDMPYTSRIMQMPRGEVKDIAPEIAGMPVTA